MSWFKLHRLAAPLMLSLAALALPQLAQASHFRGGSITWQALDLDGDGVKNDVRITVKTAWRATQIDDVALVFTPARTAPTQVSRERLCVGLGTTTTTTCGAGADYALQTTLFEARNLDPDTRYTLAFTGSARISNLKNNADGNWNIQTTIYLKDGNLAPKVDLPIILEVPKLKSDGGSGTVALPNWTFDISSSDPNADKLRYRLANQSELGCPPSATCTNAAGLSINPNTGLLTWTGSGSLVAGDMYSAGIVAEDVDAFGAAKSKTHVDFILTLVNKAAVDFDPQTDIVPTAGGTFPETRNVRVNKGASYTFDVTASNVDTTSLGSLQGTLVEGSPNHFTFTPGVDGTGLEPGSYPITFQLDDTSGTHADNYLVINFIVPDPLAPRILNIEGDRTVYNNSSTNPGDAAQQVVDDGPDAVVEDDHVAQLNGGFVLFNVTFTDGSYERLGINTAGDGAGQIRFDGDKVYYEGQVIGEIDPTQDGVGRALRINFTSNDADLAAVQALVRSLTYQDTFTLRPAGDRELSIYIQDVEGHSNSYDFFVDVHQHASAPPPNGGPLQAANRISVTEGTTTALSDSNISYADPDGDTITFTVDSVTHGKFVFVSNPGVAITTFTQQDVTLGKIAFAHDGTESAPTYSISASDGTGHTTVSSPGDITYFGTDNHNPVISGAPATTVMERSAYSFTPTASDADVGIGGQLTFSISNKPSWATFNTATGQLSGTPAHGDVGSYTNIGISVSDDGGLTKVDLTAFSIQVTQQPDSDHDGLADDLDPNDANVDTDGDGIPDGADVDVDGDGTPDNGTDSDGDGINDASDLDQVGGGDTDGDGIADAFDLVDNAADADHDGLPDALDQNDSSTDTDGDGIPDGADVDVNGDGTPDNGADSDGDGINNVADADSHPGAADTDGDGVIDDYDMDIDGDGLPNALDPNDHNADSDGDGIRDGADVDVNGDGTPDNGTDSDGDGINDASDLDQVGGGDADGDGIADASDPIDDRTDADHDGLPDVLDPNDSNADTDSDGIPDGADVDVNGDGTPDNGADSDGDGVNNVADANSHPGVTDTDHDGVIDAYDLDIDGDGLPNVFDPNDHNADTDGDGIPDGADVDFNGDGTPDIGTDSDGDGIKDAYDLDQVGGGDADDDGIADAFDPIDERADADHDGLPDTLDQNDSNTDTDGDGIPDGADVDVNGDGTPDNGADSDGDGVNNVADSNSHPGVTDTDHDGVIDAYDLDIDGDGIDNASEGSGDTDGDGVPDSRDIDVDGDGIPDILEGTADADGDGIPNYRDTDSDNDGVPDALELTGLHLDTDGDGIADRFDVDQTGGVDANGDGIDDAALPDSDHDGLSDLVDPDQDNDGIPDVRESGAYGFDSDSDGIDDRWDANTPGNTDANGDGIADDARAVDTDKDGIPDLLDLDSDNDGVSDAAESGATGVDTDSDGIDDAFDIDKVGGTDANGDGVADSAKARDSDSDGVPDYLDLDSDNDSLTDVIESGGRDQDEDSLLDVGGTITSTPRDTDGDGIPDMRDTDSNNDGTSDIAGTIFKSHLDANGDGRVDDTVDTDEDGIPDAIDVEPAHRGSPADNDGDGLPNALDPNDANVDSDGDGIPDGADVDVDGNGTPDNGTDSDHDGINDAHDVGQAGGGDADGDGIADAFDPVDDRADADHDGLPDALDPNDANADTDGDGIPDGADVDVDGNGIPENGADSDGDGINNVADANSHPGVTDTDHDGVIDAYDMDIDGDGIGNASEGSGDTDGDGVPDNRDIDVDGDGIPDVVEGTADSDGDGVPNYRDTDSDNDGVPDALELTGLHVDTDGDGIADRFDVDQTGGLDGNGDGIDDAALPDSDHDGRSDLVDSDQDNDGIPDVRESGAYGFDSDNDGIDDRWDANTPGNTDANGDGIADDARVVDTDMDGIPDLLDLDSDRDGVSDAAESGAKGVDTDGDGIDDAFDVDNVGGTDANGDGVADSAKPRDSDGDGVPDYLDLDSDNDSLPDVLESGGRDEDEDSLLDLDGTITSTPRDTDGDGIPDMRDTDSNNDGTSDIAGTIFKNFDADGDGRGDDIVDTDQDGIPDAIDVEPAQRGSRVDNDGDGVPAIRDQDDDGDGISDALEGDGDTDGDGAIDRLDQDADNDGIPDRIEVGLPAPSGIDVNRNGVDDAYENAQTRDTDGDGVPDMLDNDSDNDGIPDAREILLVSLSGADVDGDGIDDAIDVDATGGKDENHDGVDDAKINLADTDGDGLPDYRDADSDNDGFADGKEYGDFNGDGINDALQKDPGLKTGLKGGGGSFGWLSLLALFALLFARKLNGAAARTAVVMVVLGVSAMQMPAAKAQDAPAACTTGSGFTEGCWSIGAGAFATQLKPDASQSVWKVVDDSDFGYKLSAEYRFHERWFFELGYADMGSATVQNRNPAIEGREPIDYSVPSLFAGVLIFDPSNRFNIHAKVGYAQLQTDAASYVIEKQQNSDQIALGAGLRMRLWQHLELQLEHEYYDKDARQTGLNVQYAF